MRRNYADETLLGRVIDDVVRGFSSGIASVSKEYEIFAWGRQVTGRTTNLTLDARGEQFLSDPLGRWQSTDCDRDALREQAPDRGIDL